MAQQLLDFDQFFPYLFPLSGPSIGALATAGTISFSTENKDVDVETLFLDWAGATPSPKTLMVSIELADPANGSILGVLQQLEFNMVESGLHISKRGTSQKLVTNGFVRNVKASGGVGQNSSVSFDMKCRPAYFQ